MRLFLAQNRRVAEPATVRAIQYIGAKVVRRAGSNLPAGPSGFRKLAFNPRLSTRLARCHRRQSNRRMFLLQRGNAFGISGFVLFGADDRGLCFVTFANLLRGETGVEERGCWLETSISGTTLTARAGGAWTVEHAGELDALVLALDLGGARSARFDVAALTALDTAGAWILRRTLQSWMAAGIAADLSGLDPAYSPLLEIVKEADEQPHEPLSEEPHFIMAMFERVGRALFEALNEAKLLVNFFGLTIATLIAAIPRPRRLRPVALINQIEQTGLNAVPIVLLLNFLIGIVIAYQGAVQLRKFGAEIFTIDGLAFGIPREIAVLITAIVVAGRSGSAFTAQIGTMQVNQEVDALKTVGLDPIEVLVLPRINALLITLPMLVFLADVAGLMGGALMSVLALDISFGQFLRRLEDVISLTHFLVGLVKAPVFAYIIAIVGCFEGLRVTGSAESVGKMTTKAVVESIVLVILADALFSILFSALGI